MFTNKVLTTVNKKIEKVYERISRVEKDTVRKHQVESLEYRVKRLEDEMNKSLISRDGIWFDGTGRGDAPQQITIRGEVNAILDHLGLESQESKPKVKLAKPAKKKE